MFYYMDFSCEMEEVVMPKHLPGQRQKCPPGQKRDRKTGRCVPKKKAKK